MTITEIINSFEKLSPEQQDNLLEILLQTRSQTRQTQNLTDADQLKDKTTSNLSEEVQPIKELTANSTYQIWSPYDSHEAAHLLASLLNEEDDLENV